jgi:hypothetical protein
MRKGGEREEKGGERMRKGGGVSGTGRWRGKRGDVGLRERKKIEQECVREESREGEGQREGVGKRE